MGSPSPNVAVGAMVLIQHWRMGRMESPVHGGDNRVRVVQLRTTNGTCYRPVHKLALLQRGRDVELNIFLYCLTQMSKNL